MWLAEADGFAEIFKGYLPYYLLVALPLFIIMSPVNPVAASHEFSVYRMQQYDLHAVPYGSRSSSFNLEGRSLTSWSTSRHCVVARIQDVTIEKFLEIRNKAGALLLVLPRNDTVLTPEEKEHIQLLEMAMFQQEMHAPVYFAHWTPDFEDILKDLQYSFVYDDKSGTALEAMINSVSSNGYQIVVTAPTPQKIESNPITLHGKLHGKPGTTKTIIIVGSYDSLAVAPELANGADSNASGAAAVLELARVFSRLYSTEAGRGAASLLFVLTSTGHSLNYYSIKKWLEEQLDTIDGGLLQDVPLVVCLEGVSGRQLRAQVSRVPREGSAPHSLHTRLGAALQHKKINLADDNLAWHHERFSIRRMAAVTLTTFQSHKDPLRKSFLDTYSEESAENLVTNVRSIARALASHVYNITEEVNNEDAALYDDALGIDEKSIKTWYSYLASQPRAPQIITTSPPNTGVTGVLEKALSRYMPVTVSAHPPDKREPEFVLYSPTKATLFVYSVKPAVFDLILTLAIVAYLTVLYFAMQMFPRFYEEFAKFVNGKAKVH